MDEITIAAICGAVTAVATLVNNVVSQRNARAIRKVHDCLDDLHGKVDAVLPAIPAALESQKGEIWTGNDRRKPHDA